MHDLPTLYERNHQFAGNFKYGELAQLPRLATIVLTCVDARVDPAYFFGLELGDAFVLRNVGGRVTESVMFDVAFLCGMTQQASGGKNQLELALVRHTDCGLERLTNPEFERALHQHSNLAAPRLRDIAVHDHGAAIENDIIRLSQAGEVPRDLVVSGHVYDPKTGRVHQLVAPQSLKSRET